MQCKHLVNLLGSNNSANVYLVNLLGSINSANMYLVNLLGSKLTKYMFALLMIISPFIAHFSATEILCLLDVHVYSQ